MGVGPHKSLKSRCKLRTLRRQRSMFGAFSRTNMSKECCHCHLYHPLQDFWQSKQWLQWTRSLSSSWMMKFMMVLSSSQMFIFLWKSKLYDNVCWSLINWHHLQCILAASVITCFWLVCYSEWVELDKKRGTRIGSLAGARFHQYYWILEPQIRSGQLSWA